MVLFSIFRHMRKFLSVGLLAFGMTFSISQAQDSVQVSPVVTSAAMPLYPTIAVAARVQGIVKIKVTTNGTSVVSLETVSGPAMLVESAKKNIKTWMFAPHKPTTFITTFEYSFKDPPSCTYTDSDVTARLPLEVHISIRQLQTCDPMATVTSTRGRRATKPPAMAQQAPVSESRRSPVILGVLEDIPGEYSGQSDFRAVRAVFEKVGGKWRPFPTRTKSYLDLRTLPLSYPKEMKWTIAFHGRNLGEITSETPSRFNFYSEIGIERITSDSQVPTIGRKSVDYSGFQYVPVYRPLVAISQPNFHDPKEWTTAKPSPALVSAVREQFRTRFPTVSNCRNPDENIPRLWKYRDKDIQVTRAYASKDGWSLIEVNLTGYACDGPDEGTAFVGQWYVSGPEIQPRFLGTDMWFVDAGDYDNSGESEVLFAIDGYNEGGYRLFYDNFRRSSEFMFTYH